MIDSEKRCAKGKLELQNLAAILLTIYLHKSTGRLELQKDDVVKKLFFHQGNITFAASNLNEDRLGDIMLNEGKITQEQYDESVIELKKGRKRQGSILVQLGYLNTHELILAIRHQITTILFSVLPWKDGILA